MKKHILTLFCVLALLVTLAIPAFAAEYAGELNSGETKTVSSSDYDRVRVSLNSTSTLKSTLLINGSHSIMVSSFTNPPSAANLRLLGSSNNVIAQTQNNTLVAGGIYDGVYSVELGGSDAFCNFWFVFYSGPTVSPAFANPIQSGEYDVTDLIGTQTTNRMYTVRDDPKTFTFTDVTANASTVVSYALEASGGVVTYHDIGTLTEDFTFKSSDYPVADFFTVRNNGSSTVSYTVTVIDDSFEKTQSLAQNIWETCLSMGTSMINWLKTPSNFIALIPLAMFVLVGAVLMIRKLIKGA